MRLWHLLTIVLFVALVLAIARSDVGKVALIVFFTGLGEIILGVTALLHLFKTIGALGAARGLTAHLEAIVATALVLLVATLSMNAVLWAGVWLLREIVGW